MFCNALANPSHFLAVLEMLTTPESRNAWGDFTSTADFLNSIENRGYGSMVNEAFDAPDVCYSRSSEGSLSPTRSSTPSLFPWRPS
jgi:hypothetical protein